MDADFQVSIAVDDLNCDQNVRLTNFCSLFAGQGASGPYLVTLGGQTGISFGKHTFHAHEKVALEFERTEGGTVFVVFFRPQRVVQVVVKTRTRKAGKGGQVTQNLMLFLLGQQEYFADFVMIGRMHEFVHAVACQFDLERGWKNYRVNTLIDFNSTIDFGIRFQQDDAAEIASSDKGTRFHNIRLPRSQNYCKAYRRASWRTDDWLAGPGKIGRNL